MAEHLAVHEKLAAKGRLGPVARLMPTTTATTVRPGHDPLVIDGPFAETKEQLLGFYIVDCSTLDEAIKAAQDLARASSSAGAYEIRPIALRSEERRVGKECVRTCRSRWSPHHQKQKRPHTHIHPHTPHNHTPTTPPT